MQCLGTSLVFITRNTKTSWYKNPTLERIKSGHWWEAIKQLQTGDEGERREEPCRFRWSNSGWSQALQWRTVTLCWITAGSTNDPENVHLAFLLVLDTKTAGRVWSGERGGLISRVGPTGIIAQCSAHLGLKCLLSWQTKLSASLPTTWKLGRFLPDTKHHKMLHISFSPEN